MNWTFGTWEPEFQTFKTLDPDFWYPGARVPDFKTLDPDF